MTRSPALLRPFVRCCPRDRDRVPRRTNNSGTLYLSLRPHGDTIPNSSAGNSGHVPCQPLPSWPPREAIARRGGATRITCARNRRPPTTSFSERSVSTPCSVPALAAHTALAERSRGWPPVRRGAPIAARRGHGGGVGATGTRSRIRVQGIRVMSPSHTSKKHILELLVPRQAVDVEVLIHGRYEICPAAFA